MREAFPRPAPREVIGLAWLHALHARVCILRGKFRQAEYMIHATRDYVMTLACLRHRLPAAQGRGMDALPDEVTTELRASLVGELGSDELWRALTAVVRVLVDEICEADPELAGRIGLNVLQITSPASHDRN